MEISIKWFNDNFNVALSAKAGTDPFLEVKGCRLVNGQNGMFVGWPATKNANTGKWWNHVYGSDKFNAAVLEKAQATQPSGGGRSKEQRHDQDGDIPW